MQLLSTLKYIKHVQKCSICQKNVAIRIQVKDLLSISSLKIIWSIFLLLTLSKLLRKSVLLRKSLFHMFWHWFVTLSYKRYGGSHFLHTEVAIQICFYKIAGKNRKKLLPELFSSYLKRIYPMNNHNFAKFEMCTPPPKIILGWEQREENNNITRDKIF